MIVKSCKMSKNEGLDKLNLVHSAYLYTYNVPVFTYCPVLLSSYLSVSCMWCLNNACICLHLQRITLTKYFELPSNSAGPPHLSATAHQVSCKQCATFESSFAHKRHIKILSETTNAPTSSTCRPSILCLFAIYSQTLFYLSYCICLTLCCTVQFLNVWCSYINGFNNVLL